MFDPRFQAPYDLLVKGFTARSVAYALRLNLFVVANVSEFMAFPETPGPILSKSQAMGLRLRGPVGMSIVAIEDVCSYALLLARSDSSYYCDKAYVYGLLDAWCVNDSVRDRFYSVADYMGTSAEQVAA